MPFCLLECHALECLALSALSPCKSERRGGSSLGFMQPARMDDIIETMANVFSFKNRTTGQ